MKERWSDVPGYEGRYQVSDHGRVNRLPQTYVAGKQVRTLIGGILQPHYGERGYPRVNLFKGRGYRTSVNLSRLVLTVFDRPPQGREIARCRCAKADASLANLYWGPLPTKLTVEQVKEARQRVRAGEKYKSIAKDMGVKDNTVRYAVTGYTWNWVENVNEMNAFSFSDRPAQDTRNLQDTHDLSRPELRHGY